MAVLILLLCTLSLYNPGDESLDRAVLQVEVNGDLADGEIFTPWHAELNLKRLVKLVLIALMYDHIGVPLGYLHLEVDLLEWDHLVQVPTDSEQLKAPILHRTNIVFAPLP